MRVTLTPIWEQSEAARLAAARRRVSNEWLVVRVTTRRVPARRAAPNLPLPSGSAPAPGSLR
jgi:hypothetical protein